MNLRNPRLAISSEDQNHGLPPLQGGEVGFAEECGGECEGDDGPEEQVIGEVSLWDLKTGQPKANLPVKDIPVHSVAFSPDGLTLATSSSGVERGTQLWDVKTGQLKGTFKKAAGTVAFSPDGETLITGIGESKLRLWDVKTLQEKTTLPVSSNSVAFSPDGQTLASVFRAQVKLWPESLSLASVYGDEVRLWDVKTGQARVTFQQHGAVKSVAFSPDGLTLASGSDNGTVKLWDLKTEPAKTTFVGGERFGHVHGVCSVAFSPDNLTFATGFSCGARLWDIKTGQPRVTLKGNGLSGNVTVVFSPDGLTLAGFTSGNQSKIVGPWDVKTGQPTATLPGQKKDTICVAFSPDGLSLASGGMDNDLMDPTKSQGSVRLWDVKTGQLKTTLQGHKDAVLSVAFSPDGLILAMLLEIISGSS